MGYSSFYNLSFLFAYLSTKNKQVWTNDKRKTVEKKQRGRNSNEVIAIEEMVEQEW